MSSRSDDIAVIGMAGRFPGANSVSEFWSNLLAGKGSIRTLGDEALRRAGVPEEDIADPDYVKVAATIDNVEMFDPAFFKISPVEAELMDPQIRLLLQCAWETLEDAGYARRDAQNVGVFAGAGGVTTGYFANFINLTRRFEKITAGSTHLGNDKDFLSTYISYKLNLTGPSMTVQTACSTSLVALHQARLSLLAGECDMALAGGVTIRVPHEQGYRYREGYIFSKSGRISTFDSAADGVVFGNGLGLVLLKRLDAAIADGDNIQAVIKGSAITNDGRGKMSYAASSAKGQITCVRAAMRDAGVDAADLGFVESHGTGTAMGDPEEVKALSAAFREYTDARGYCALGAVKTNIGHLEAAAGIVGFIKAALAVKHGRIPPTLHYAAPNPRIRFETTPFYVNSAPVDWKADREPRRAAVNSLGVGGTNAFVVIEEYRKSAKPAARGTKSRAVPLAAPLVVPLSAKTDVALHALASRLAAALREADPRPNLADISHTLCIGREHMARRVAFVVVDHDALLAALDAFMRHEPLPLPPGREAELAATWQAGEDVDWSVLRGDGKPVRVSLPTYPFALERCWIDEVPEAAPAPAASRLHPLVHANTSDLNEQKYSSSFGGEEFFLKDHVLRISGQASGGARSQRILPGVAYLEMARAAIECAAPIHRDSAIPQLEDVVWLHPIAVASDTAVHIALVARTACGQASQRIDFEVYTSDDRIHCQGRCRHIAAVDAPHHDIDHLTARIADAQWDASRLYDAFRSMGLEYGPAHRPITRLCTGDNEVLAQLRLPAPVEGGADAFVLHPSLMDGALQAATALLFDPDSPPVHPIVPFALERVRIHGACPADIRVWARHSEGSRPFDKSARLDIDLMDESGRVLVEIRGFMARPLRRTAAGSFLATRTWRADASLPVASAYAGQHVVLCALPQIQPERIARDCELLPCKTDVSIADRYTELARACFAKLKRVFASRPEGRTLVQVALPATVDTALFAGLAGMFRTARLENPHVSGQLILVDEDITTERLGELLHDERGHPHDSLIRYVDGVRQVEHWELLKAEAPSLFEHEGAFRDRGVYLITGGLGGLGRLFAREILARTPTARVVLCGRSTPAEIARSRDTTAALEALRAGGGTVEYRAIDLADADALQTAIAEIARDHGRIDGILHSAGHIADNYILKKTEEEFLAVLAPKVHGTWHLDQATRGLDLDFFVLFSSLTSAVGNLGQADYAAANGFMDEFAGWRNARVRAGERKGHTLTIRWPLWQNGGMKPEPAEVELLRETTGIYPMRTGTGMRMFYRSLARGLDQTLVMEGDLAAMQRALGHGAMLHASRATPEPETAAPRANSDSAGTDNERVERYLCEILASVLKLPAERIDTRAALENYGIDSILALDLTRALESRFGALPKTLFFEYLTIAELAGYFAKSHAATLERVLAGGAAPAAPVAARDTQGEGEGVTSIRLRGRCRVAEAEPAAVREPIAIVGVSGRYPESPDLRAFWHNLRDGRDCIVEVPRERWDWRDYYSEDRSEKGRHFSKWGGFIEGVDAFDARFFNISPVEAENIDPQERLFLEHAWHAIEDAGYTREALRIANANDPDGRDLPAQVGVYAGAMYGEYQLFGAEASLAGERMGFASNPASIANRVSYFLNVHGPSMTVDTMCSSSLTAIHLACQDLRLGRTALGIAGGVNVTIHPNKYLMLSAGQFISGDGHCQSFGEGGDGYIPGEGVGVVVLKRVSDARRDGDRIHALIRGTSLSHGGKTNGFTVPNPQAQASAIRQALRDAEIDPRHIGYIEAHGTGTKLGDPIEIAALAKVFQESTPETGFCAIGSVKSNIGHAEAAAGIAGLTKVLLQLRYRQIVPSLHSARLNPHIDFASTPFVVNQTLRPWEAPTVEGRRLPRIAGISSFGAGGSNAHVIVEEAPQPAVVDAQGPQLFPVSARNAAQLRQKLEDLLAFLEDESQADLSPVSLAWTLQHGREAMDHRWIARADDRAGLIGLLKDWLANGNARDTWHDDARAHRDAMSVRARDEADVALQRLVDARDFDAVAAQWVRSARPDWSRLHPRRPALVSLPGYPFARQRYWRDPAAALRSRGLAAAGIAPLHPLLHENASGLDGIRYRARFAAGDAAPDGEGRLSLVASLDMAFAAFRHATDATTRGDAAGALELRDLRWALPQPMVADQALTIHLHDGDEQAASFELTLGEGDDERVLCQGRVARSQTPAAKRTGTAAAALVLPTTLPAASKGAALRLPAPAIEAALRAVLPDPAVQLQAIDLVRDVFPLQGAGQATVHARSTGHDLELCDASGTVCIELRGVRAAAAIAATVQAPQQVVAPTPQTLPAGVDTPRIDIQPATVRSAILAPQWRTLAFVPVRLDDATASADAPDAPSPLPAKPARIALSPLSVQGDADDAPVPAKPTGIALGSLNDTADAASPERGVLPKPTGIVLATPASLAAPERSNLVPAKPRHALAALASATAPHAAATTRMRSAVTLDARDDGLLVLRIDAGPGNALDAHLVSALIGALRAAERVSDAKLLQIEGRGDAFLVGDADAHALAVRHGLYAALLTCALPIAVVVRGDARGVGAVFAACADLLLIAETARFEVVDAAMPAPLSPASLESLMSARFGQAEARDLLYLRPRATGADLRARGWRCEMAAPAALDARLQAITTELLAAAPTSLRLLKAHLARGIVQVLDDMDAAQAAATADVVAPSTMSPSKLLILQPHDKGVLLARLPDKAGKAVRKADVLATALRETLAEAARRGWRCLVLDLTTADARNGLLSELGAAQAQALADVLRDAPLPVIVAQLDAIDGHAWWIALHAFAVVHAREGRYSLRAALDAPSLAASAAPLLRHAFDDETARILLLAGGETDGSSLQARCPVLPVVAAADVVATALSLADAIAALPASSLVPALAKRARALQVSVTLPSTVPAAGSNDTSEAWALQTQVISATRHADGVVEVRMADRDARNMFSDAFSSGMREVFARIADDVRCRVVVLTGYDNYFASGGTPETLLSIQQGREVFTDNTVFALPLFCPVPVIAAMQGHGIGAGWALGMYADDAVFSSESRYVSPYMGYGFTPGAGATGLIPARIGLDLGRESLLAAREYAGDDLGARGLRQRVLPRARVVDEAMTQARRIARLPRAWLEAVKAEWATPARAALADVFARELAMHDATFVGDAGTLARIRARFAPTQATVSAPVAAPQIAAPQAVAQPTAVQASLDPATLVPQLKALLAHELRMEEGEIGENEQFVDLGLDSITGVTWIRRINEAWGTDIEAIRVYSYPTLRLLATHVAEEAAKAGGAPVVSQPVAEVQASAPDAPVLPAPAPVASTGVDPASIVPQLKSLLAHELRMEEGEIGEDEQFVDLGLDSITGVTWIRRINEAWGTDIEAIRVYSYPTLRLLAAHVAEEAAKAAGVPVVSQPVAEAPVTVPVAVAVVPAAVTAAAVVELRSRRGRGAMLSAGRAGSIAIIGMAGRFAKSPDLDAFWRNIAEGRDCIEEVPAERWDIDAYFQAGDVAPGRTYSRWMGVLDDADAFDATFFNISPREARAMDPQQRVFLEACWHAIEHAGLDPKSLGGSRCGVFAGCSAGDYHQRSRREQWSGQGFTGAAPSILAARIAYVLDLHGPNLSIDTACSSSLVAVATACDSLASGGSDLALAGGVNVMSGPAMQVMTAQVGMLSPDGRCFAFDARANGIANGEGVGVVLLKRLADAERDGDRIDAVIEGWGVNQDGRTNGITAPNADSQARLQREVHARFGIDPAGIQLIEAHGTGTPLGDPIEVAGLKASFAGHDVAPASCALGSVKSNIGHCLTAAGISGLLKAALALRHRQLPPAANFARLNPHIALRDTPFYVNERRRPWDVASGQARRAAVNSFGFSGTNAHVVLAEYDTGAAVAAANDGRPELVVLSARSRDRLLAQAQALRDALQGAGASAPALADIAHTLRVGREAMVERLAVVATSVTELLARLDAWIAREGDASRAMPERVRDGRVGGGRGLLPALSADPDFRTIVDKWVARGELDRLAELWVEGLDLDGAAFISGTTPRRVALPGYAFARDRFWLDGASDTEQTTGEGGTALHPLVQRNVSTLDGQRYRSRFDARMPFAASQSPTAAVCLDMARVAITDALPGVLPEGATWRLHDIVWTGDAPAEVVDIALARDGEGAAFAVLDAEGRVHCEGLASPVNAGLVDVLQTQGSADPALLSRFLDAAQTAPAVAPAARDAIRALWRDGDVVCAHLSLAEALRPAVDDVRRALLLDAALLIARWSLDHIMTAPVALGWIDASGAVPADAALVAVHRHEAGATLRLADEAGRVFLQLDGLSLQAATAIAVTESVIVPVGPAPTVLHASSAQPQIEATVAATPAIPLSRIRDELCESLAEALFMRAVDIDPQRSFTELGLDSIIGVEWIKAVNKRYGTTLSATRVYDHPSVDALAAHLQAQIAPLPVAPVSQASAVAVAAIETPLAASTVAAAPSLAELERSLRDSLGEALFMTPTDIDPQRSFTELGLDSIIGVEWIKAVNKQHGTTLSATRVYDHPTVRALALHLQAQIAPVAAVALQSIAPQPIAPQSVAAPAPIAASVPTPVASPSPAKSLAQVREGVRSSLAEALFMRAEDIDPQRSFTELGLDSIIGVEWVKVLNQRHGTTLSATRVYDHPTVEALSAHLHAQLPVVAAPLPAARAPAAIVADAATPATAAMRAPVAARVDGHRALRGRDAGGLRFEPKFSQAYRDLYFAVDGLEGDFAAEERISVRCTLVPERNIPLREHVVFGQHLLPTDAWLELVLAAFRTCFSAGEVSLQQIALVAPLIGVPGRATTVEIEFRRHGSGLLCIVRSGPAEDARVHLQARIEARSASIARTPLVAADIFETHEQHEAAQIATNAGTWYAPLQQLRFGDDRAEGLIRVAEHALQFVAEPFALYGALCTAINHANWRAAREHGASSDQFLPVRIERFATLAPIEGRDFTARVALREADRDRMRFDIALVDAQGREVAVMEGVLLQRVPSATLQAAAHAAAQTAQSSPSLPALPVAPVSLDAPVAIVGMACRYPMSPDIDAFWDNLRNGRDCVVEVPESRWGARSGWFHPDPRHADTTYSQWAGLVDDVDAFDPLFFGISPAEAEIIEPQQRVFLEECWKALESAGHAPGSLSGLACGVYVGCAAGDYVRRLGAAGKDALGAAFMGTSTAILAARIAYHLNLKGPALAIDTACSSSLVAVHLACESIRSGENEMALAGGVNLLTTAHGHVLTAQVGMPSRDGRCATFDAGANGIVFSEGCGVVVLKSLAAAQRDNDEILGVIAASGINQDGKTNGITAPSATAQEQLLRTTYARFGIDPARIGYIEAHGTATALGDPIEVDALGAVHGPRTAASRDCVLGSVKSNIGHTGFAAGIAGLIKVLLCLRHRSLVPSLHYATPNPHIDFAASRFRVGTELAPWQAEGPRMASVSSFGFSGTNAHVVIAEAAPAAADTATGVAPDGRVLLPLSARTAESLDAQIRALLAWVETHADALDPVAFARMAWTLQVGRDAMAHRVAVLAASPSELAARLNDALRPDATPQGVHRGRVAGDDALLAFAEDPEMQGVIERWVETRQLGRLADLWVRGYAVDWRRLHGAHPPRRMAALPTYRFARERCWVDGTDVRVTRIASTLHPLLHRNVSDLSRQTYRSTFGGDEFFLADHRVAGRRVLPAVAYFEIARAALRDASPEAIASGQAIELRHVAFAQPLFADDEAGLAVEVFEGDDSQFGFEVFGVDDAGGNAPLHCAGSIALVPVPAPERLSLDALRARMTKRHEPAALYARFAAQGLEYGPAFQGIVVAVQGEGECLVELRLPESAQVDGFQRDGSLLNPALLDSALQGAILLLDAATGDAPSVPFAVESLQVLGECGTRMHAWVRSRAGAGGMRMTDLDLCDEQGDVRLRMRGFSARTLDVPTAFDEDHYRNIIDGVLSRELSADEAVELG